MHGSLVVPWLPGNAALRVKPPFADGGTKGGFISFSVTRYDGSSGPAAAEIPPGRILDDDTHWGAAPSLPTSPVLHQDSLVRRTGKCGPTENMTRCIFQSRMNASTAAWRAALTTATHTSGENTFFLGMVKLTDKRPKI